MWIFWTVIILQLIAVIVVPVTVYQMRGDKVMYSLPEWVNKHRLFILIPAALVFLFSLWAMSGKLWSTVGCAYDGYTYNVETEYNWIKSTCLYTGKNGAKLPLKFTRDTPDGKDRVDTTDIYDTPAEH